MSDSDKPSDQKRRNHTVILGGSSGSRPSNPPAATPPGSKTSGPRTTIIIPNVSPPPSGPPSLAPAPRAAPAPRSNTRDNDGSEDWIRAQDRPPPAPSALGPLPSIDLNALVSPHDNPIMRAAGPLLLLLGRLRAAVLRAPLAGLMEQVAEAVRFFEKDIRSAGISEEQARSAKYILCATADDIVQNIPTDDRHVWTQYSMLARFFRERTGGVRFFDEVDRAKLDPLRNFQLLELQYTCLALGFQGVHRASPNGQMTLQQIQRNLYEILRQIRPRLERDLSPHWQGLTLRRGQGWYRVPVWIAGSVAGLGLLGLFVIYRILLSGGTEVTIDRLRAMHSQELISLERRVFAEPLAPPPPPPPVQVQLTQLQRIQLALAPEIAAGQVAADQTRTQIVIRVGALVLFASGNATVLKQFEPIGARIAAVLDKEPRSIKIVGHTDNARLSGTSRFGSNLALSLERAKAVAVVLQRGLADPSRVITEGKADEEPLAPNTTPDGRAKNRRVELAIERDD